MRHAPPTSARLFAAALLGAGLLAGPVAATPFAPAPFQDPWDDFSDDTLDDASRKLLNEIRRPSSDKSLAEAARTLRAKGGKAAAEAVKALRDLEAKRRKALETAARHINQLVRPVGDNDANKALREHWEKARAYANKWLFNSVNFPPPKVQPVTGPVEGYDEAKARGDAAIQAHKALRKRLDGAVSGLLRTSAKKAAKLRAGHAAALAEWNFAYTQLFGNASRLQGVGAIDGLAGLFLDVAEGHYTQAAAAYRRLPAGWRKLAAFHAYSRAILERNQREPCGMGKQAVRGLEGNNWYRMSLGISPLWHNAHLATAAQGHSDEMVALGYFGHDSPVAENDTIQKRVTKAGYRGHATECCSSSSTPSSAMEMWKWDGGHHRAMIHWTWTEAGCSERGPCVLNPGAGEKGSPPGIRY